MSDNLEVTSPKILIGPSNMAGQAYQWAESINSESDYRATSFTFREGEVFNFPFHQTSQKAKEFIYSSEGLSIVLEGGVWIDGSKPDLLGWKTILEELEERSHQVRFVLHGSDIRDPFWHMEVHSGSIFKQLSEDRLKELNKRTQYTKRIIEYFGIDSCYTTPDLAKYLPFDAVWLPLVLEHERVKRGRPEAQTPSCRSEDLPLIYHNPSSMDLKGSGEIGVVIQSLCSLGKARSYPESGRVPHSSNLKRISAADVVVDQIGIGGLGLTALEAIDLGTIVVSDVGPEAEEVYAATIEAGLLVPVHADGGLERAVEKALQLAAKRGQNDSEESSVKQIRSLHSGSLSTQCLESLFSKV